MLVLCSTVSEKEKMGGDKRGAGGGGGGSNGFKALGLSEAVYKGIVRMGFRVGGHFLPRIVWWRYNFSTNFFSDADACSEKSSSGCIDRF